MNYIEIFTDGSCRNNQSKENVGGYGAVMIYKDYVKKIIGGQRNTTNNVMEIKSVVEALKMLKKHDIKINVYSDSSYVVNCIKNKWYVKWESNGWKNSAKKDVENIELWKELLCLKRMCNDINFYKIKGHLKEGSKEFDKWYKKFCDNEYPILREEYLRLVEYNNLADELANEGALKYDSK